MEIHKNSLNLELDQKGLKIEELETNNKKLRDKVDYLAAHLKVLGDEAASEAITEEATDQDKNIWDFLRDWDTSDFYQKGVNLLCPIETNGRNRQRMYYKHSVPLVGTQFNLKFKMANEDDNQVYSQRVIVGSGIRGSLISEFDFTTRDFEEVNLRVASASGELVPVKPGKEISSPMKEGGVINLTLESSSQMGSEITEILYLDYKSKIEKKGDENDKIKLDINVGDPQPENSTTSLFFGSYLGGCIEIINWSVVD
ncbi:hypothetical protein ACFL18_00645 [Patescibacteria group bacterium]